MYDRYDQGRTRSHPIRERMTESHGAGKLARRVRRGGCGDVQPARVATRRVLTQYFVQMLTYKCLLAGKVLEVLDERDTSKTCSGCGHQQPMPLWKRTYRCGTCGLEMDRDENSAVNLRERFLARLVATHG